MKKSTLKVLATTFLGHLAISSTAQVVAPTSAPTTVTTTPASSPTFIVGTNILNLGLGFAGSWDAGATSSSPAFQLSFERGIKTVGMVTFGAGIYGGYQSASAESIFYTYKANCTVFGVRGSVHYPAASNFDVYGSFGFGLRRISLSNDALVAFFGSSKSASLTTLTGVALIGGRYNFSNKIGAFAELGYDQTYLKIGAAFRL